MDWLPKVFYVSKTRGGPHGHSISHGDCADPRKVMVSLGVVFFFFSGQLIESSIE